MSALGAWLRQIDEIALEWESLRTPWELSDFKAAHPPQGALVDALETAYALQTRLRRLKRELNAALLALVEQQPGRSGVPLTRESLQAYRQNLRRYQAVLADIDTLFSAIEVFVAPLEQQVGKVTYIYALSDPDTGEVRYVGKTEDPRKRLGEHLSSPTNDDMRAWLDTLKARGQQPAMEILEVVTDGSWVQREARQIWRFRQMGYDLLNRDGP
ncbi:MAG: hypothetical protein Kow00124_20840 [Anaerolineae bacterium]